MSIVSNSDRVVLLAGGDAVVVLCALIASAERPAVAGGVAIYARRRISRGRLLASSHRQAEAVRLCEHAAAELLVRQRRAHEATSAGGFGWRSDAGSSEFESAA